MTPSDLAARAAFAQELARTAGALATRYFRREIEFEAECKGPQDWVSAADRAVEAHIRAALARAFPGDAMLGEESGGALGDRLWVVDPIDGTLNFVHGVRYWCVSLAFVADGVREIGVIHDPSLDELFWARRGEGAWCGTQRLSVSACAALDRALVAAGYVPRHPLAAHLATRAALFAAGAAHAALDNAKAEAMMKKDGCAACHAVDKKIVGPAYVEVAAKYKNDKNAVATLTKKVKEGGSGVWGQIPMPPNAAVSEADVKELVAWLLTLKK